MNWDRMLAEFGAPHRRRGNYVRRLPPLPGYLVTSCAAPHRLCCAWTLVARNLARVACALPHYHSGHNRCARSDTGYHVSILVCMNTGRGPACAVLPIRQGKGYLQLQGRAQGANVVQVLLM